MKTLIIFLLLAAPAIAADWNTQTLHITKSGIGIPDPAFITQVKVNGEGCKAILYDGLEAKFSTKRVHEFENPELFRGGLTVGICGKCTVDVEYFVGKESTPDIKKLMEIGNLFK